MKKSLYFFSIGIIGYLLLGGIFFLGGRGVNAKGVISTIVKPLDFIFATVHPILNSTWKNLSVEFSNGHLYEPSGKVYDKLNEDLFLLNTVKNEKNESFVEIRNLNTSKIIKSIKLPTAFTNGLEKRQRYFATYNSELKKIIVITHHRNRVLCIDVKSNKPDWILDSDSILFHHRVATYGTNIYVNIRKIDTIDNTRVRNEGFAVIDISRGSLKTTWWIHDHLEELGPLQALQGSSKTYDKLSNNNVQDFWHINDIIEVNLKNTEGKAILKDKDIILSARNINAILLIRNKKIMKVLQGNFFKQHDVDFVNGNLISIFNNNSNDLQYPWKQPICSNIVYKNLISDKDSFAYENIKLSTHTEGQYEKIENFTYFENQNNHEIIIMKDGNIIYRGQIKSAFNKKKVNLLNWCQLILSKDL